jgi:hypothetical protein
LIHWLSRPRNVAKGRTKLFSIENKMEEENEESERKKCERTLRKRDNFSWLLCKMLCEAGAT